jgi:hypothetical protein
MIIMSGLYQKCSITLPFARIIKYASTVTLQIVATFTDDSRGVIYNCNMFIAHATDCL